MPKLTIRQKILKQRGIAGFQPQTRQLIEFGEQESTIPKTHLMRYLELKHNKSIEELLDSGSNYELEKKLGVDFSTISKWRKMIREADNGSLHQ
jgi:hypothetical protein